MLVSRCALGSSDILRCSNTSAEARNTRFIDHLVFRHERYKTSRRTNFLGGNPNSIYGKLDRLTSISPFAFPCMLYGIAVQASVKRS